jgi:transposase
MEQLMVTIHGGRLCPEIRLIEFPPRALRWHLSRHRRSGHERHTRPPYPPESIDQAHPYELTCCPCCQTPHTLILQALPPRIIQQTEVKEIVVTREEHRAYAYWCEACGQRQYAEFPPQVLREGLFKTRLTALVAYLKNLCHASFSTIRKFIRDVLGEKVSRGYLTHLPPVL